MISFLILQIHAPLFHFYIRLKEIILNYPNTSSPMQVMVVNKTMMMYYIIGIAHHLLHTTNIGKKRKRNLKMIHLKLQTGKDRKSTRLNSSHVSISYAVFCLK